MTGRGPDDPAGSSDGDDPPTGEPARNAPADPRRGDPAELTESGARAGRDRPWRALRTLVGLLLLSWLLAALFAPPDPFTFLLVLVPSWVLAVPLAWYLVYRNGYDRLRESGLYEPSASAAGALSAFVVVALLVKVVGTVALDAGVGSRPYAVDAALSVVALGGAYLMVYVGTGGE